MVESLKELNEICQKPQYKEVGNWMVRKILRPAALPITWLLLHTSITANQVTLIAIFTGLAGIFLLSLQGTGMFLAGCLLLQLWYLLDHVDGQIARYRKTVSLTGRFYDFLMHHLIHGVLFWGLAGYVYSVTGNIFFLNWGFWICLSVILFNIIYDIQYKTFFEWLVKYPNTRVRKTGKSETPEENTQSAGNPLKKGFSVLHKLAEIHVVMNILTGAALLQCLPLFAAWNMRMILFVVYGLAVPFLSITKLVHFILNKKADSAYTAAFEETTD